MADYIRCLFDSEKYCDKISTEFSDKPTCFLAYSFSDELAKEIYYIKEVLKDEGIEPISADDYTEYNKIMLCNKICKNIVNSSFCIAVLTGVKPKKIKAPKNYKEPNANVYFEYGLMTGIGKNVIPLLKNGQEIKFDFRPIEVMLYDEIDDSNVGTFKEKVRKDVRDMLICINKIQKEKVKKRLKEIRDRRIRGNNPTDMPVGPRIMLHIIPLSALSDEPYNLKLEQISNNPNDFRELYSGFEDPKYNQAGIIFPYYQKWYLQIYEKGCIEYLNVAMFNFDDKQQLPTLESYYEYYIIKTLTNCISAYKKLGVKPPFYVMLSIVNLDKHLLYHRPDSRFSSWDSKYPINDKDILPDSVTINGYDENLDQIMKPAFQKVWRAAGQPDSLNYKGDALKKIPGVW